ncbi:MAG: hypothetical protein A2091_00300 [Desulfuromonadales bacterium GWD2_61_12]|nr:MAG: hypothetical protein A2005_12960 [Desulfuromonadales bacterium GWC2_61_20]OGR32177.1 MAG: hypothetical protein A2091_00300 [Desulfuromonadales bacterium GWD2_61_12]HAD04133.1 hypothetical protein [Desulfuromonas sp.]
MKQFIPLLFVALVFFAPAPGMVDLACAEDQAKIVASEGGYRPDFSLELDAYYTSASLTLPLTVTPVPNLGELSEMEIYRYLLPRSLLPRFVTLEASLYPMPILGVYTLSNHPDIYANGDIGADINIIESVTAGFREPYALSLFSGTVADFARSGESRKGGNRAYIGYLFSYGNRHIKDNVLIDDHWFEFEWKLKGDRDFNFEQLSWSFRLGSRIHENRDITDTIYLGLRRSNVDFRSSALSVLKNSSVTFMAEFAATSGKFLRQEVVVGKVYPLESLNLALALDLGGIWQSGSGYSGALGEEAADNFIFVFRPNIKF